MARAPSTSRVARFLASSHNGAGKSTLFKMMLGLVPATQGSIVVGGAQVGGRDFRAARRHLGYLPENVVLYDNSAGPGDAALFRAPQTCAPNAMPGCA